MFENLSKNLNAFLERSIDVWGDGGWAMYVLAVVSFEMFAVGFHVLFRLLSRGHQWLPERVWRGWIDRPLERIEPSTDLPQDIGFTHRNLIEIEQRRVA